MWADLLPLPGTYRVKEVSRVLQEGLKGISKKREGCFERALRVSQESFKGLSKKFKWCFKEVLWLFKESLKGFD